MQISHSFTPVVLGRQATASEVYFLDHIPNRKREIKLQLGQGARIARKQIPLELSEASGLLAQNGQSCSTLTGTDMHRVQAEIRLF